MDVVGGQTAGDKSFKEGDTVLGNFNGVWYPGTIFEVELDGTFAVQWEEGATFTYGMTASDLRHRASSGGGAGSSSKKRKRDSEKKAKPASSRRKSGSFTGKRIVLNDDLRLRRKLSIQDIARKLMQNKKFEKLLRECSTSSAVTPMETSLAPTSAASSSSSSTSLLFDLKHEDIVAVRDPCLGQLPVHKLNEAIRMMETESSSAVFKKNQMAVYIALALTSTEGELDSFISGKEGWLMDQDSGGRPLLDIKALTLLPKNAISERGTYEWSWKVVKPKAFVGVALEVIRDNNAPNQHRGHLQDLVTAIERQALSGNDIKYFLQRYVGESTDVSRRLSQHLLLTSGTTLGVPMTSMMQKKVTELSTTCIVYRTTGLKELTSLIALSPTVAGHGDPMQAAQGISEVARTLLMRSSSAGLSEVPCLGLNLSSPGGSAFYGQNTGADGHRGDRIFFCRKQVTMDTITAAKGLIGITGPFLRVPFDVWDMAFTAASDETLACLYFSNAELFGMGERIHKDDDELTLAQAQSGHSSAAG